MTAAPMASVAVAGSGLTAWSAAAALRRRIPSLNVTVAAAPVAPNALADRMISTLPSIRGFHADIGLTDEDTITRARSALRLGSLFEGWAIDLPDYVHAYGTYGTSFGGVPFHQLWLRERRRSGVPPFDHFSPAAEMARAGRIPNGPTPDIQAGLQLTTSRYCEMMRAYALHLGVREARGSIIDVDLHPDSGVIESVRVAGNEQIRADLYLDCSGPPAILRSRLRSDFVRWNSWLPCDRLVITQGNPVAQVQTMDRVTASACGWRWLASSPEHSSKGLAYSSAHVADGDLEGDIFDLEPSASHETIEISQGRRGDLWVGNCVAIGDAAVAVEPLEWTNLHLAHSQIDRVVTMMPSADCNPIELTEFNRQCAAEADRVRDFLCLHYVCSRRQEPFWKDAGSISPPQSLAHSLSLFSERGRLPYYEEETFSRDSWLAVLLGQGFEPRAIDPLADIVSSAQSARAFASMGQSLSSFTLPAESSPPELNPHGIR